MARAFSIILLCFYGSLIAGGVVLVLSVSRFWLIGLLVSAGGMLAAFEEARILLADSRQMKPRGFEVKLITGETPVLQKKEDHHG